MFLVGQSFPATTKGAPMLCLKVVTKVCVLTRLIEQRDRHSEMWHWSSKPKSGDPQATNLEEGHCARIDKLKTGNIPLRILTPPSLLSSLDKLLKIKLFNRILSQESSFQRAFQIFIPLTYSSGPNRLYISDRSVPCPLHHPPRRVSRHRGRKK